MLTKSGKKPTYPQERTFCNNPQSQVMAMLIEKNSTYKNSNWPQIPNKFKIQTKLNCWQAGWVETLGNFILT